MKKQKKCYIYTRVSTAMQVDGYSLDAQKDKLRKYRCKMLPFWFMIDADCQGVHIDHSIQG